jgi:hypothetical protein
MKFLKPFNLLVENENTYFYETGCNIDKVRVDIRQEAIDIIRGWLKEKKDILWAGLRSYNSKTNWFSIDTKEGIEIDIYEYKDEWFSYSICMKNSSDWNCYLCDQLEGLKRFLETRNEHY